MKVLIHECLPLKLTDHLKEHQPDGRGIRVGGKKNGKLSLAEPEFDVLTLDKNIPYEQDFSSRRIAVLRVRSPYRFAEHRAGTGCQNRESSSALTAPLCVGLSPHDNDLVGVRVKVDSLHRGAKLAISHAALYRPKEVKMTLGFKPTAPLQWLPKKPGPLLQSTRVIRDKLSSSARNRRHAVHETALLWAPRYNPKWIPCSAHHDGKSMQVFQSDRPGCSS